MNRAKKNWIRAAAIRMVAYPTAFAAFIYGCADGMIFYPPPASYTADANVIQIPVTEKETIAAMYRPADANGFVLLFSHGNAEDIGQNEEFFELANQAGFGVFAYDYRGYGLSGGKASEKHTYRDLLAAYRYLTETLKVPAERILILGRSVGSGPSVWLAMQKPAAGLILESPFVSAFRVITRWKILPFDKFNNLARIKQVQCPVLIIQGKQDEVIGFWHGPTLFEAANEPKMHYWVEDAGHNDLLWVAGEEYWEKLKEFTEMIATRKQNNQ